MKVACEEDVFEGFVVQIIQVMWSLENPYQFYAYFVWNNSKIEFKLTINGCIIYFSSKYIFLVEGVKEPYGWDAWLRS